MNDRRKANSSNRRALASSREQAARKRDKLKRHLLNAITSSGNPGQTRIQTPKGRGKRSQRLLRHSPGNGRTGIARNHRTGTYASRSTLIKVRENESDLPVAAVVRHPTMSSYRSAVEHDKGVVDAALAEGSVYHGARFHEHEFMRDGSRRLVMSGRELLGEATNNRLVAVQKLTGTRYGVYLVAPEWLGGRAQYFSDTFQQHKAKRLRLVWEPCVPATREGTIVLYFNNDVALPTVETGISELRHAATHQDFLESPIWECASLEVDPESALNRYFDEGSGDMRLQVQGAIVLLAGSATDLGAAETVGHLYLEYELEFWTPALDYSVPTTPTFEMDIIADYGASLPATEQAVCFSGASVGTGYGTFTLTSTSAGISTSVLPGYMASFTLDTVPGEWATDQFLTWLGHGTTRNFVEGQTLWLRFIQCTSGSAINELVCFVFDNPESAASAILGSSVTSMEDDGALRWATTSAPNDTLVLSGTGILSKLRE